MKPLVELWDGVGLGLIMEWPSGVLYSNQTGGASTLHPAIEGVYVPVRNDCIRGDERLLSPETDLLAYFEGPPHQGTGAVTGLDLADAEMIDAVLGKWKIRQLRVNRKRLAESHEAWVWVTIAPPDGGPLDLTVTGFDPYPRTGVLTWSNSD